MYAGDIDLSDLQESRMARAESAPARLESTLDGIGSCDATEALEPLDLAGHHAEGGLVWETAMALFRPGYRDVIYRLSNSMTAAARRQQQLEQVAVRAALCTDTASRRLPGAEETIRFADYICSRTILKTCTVLAASIYLDRIADAMRSLVVVDGISWELVLLALLIVSAKQWESDAPIYTADFIDAARKWPSLTGLRPQLINVAERRVLRCLDYRTMVSRHELVSHCWGEEFGNRNRVEVSASAAA